MFCERPYATPAPVRLYADPYESACGCGGDSFLADFDADCGYTYRECRGCLGTSLNGSFLIRTTVGQMSFESGWTTAVFADAVARAERSAGLLRGINAFHRSPCEVAVVYIPFEVADGDDWQLTVHAVAVSANEPLKAA